MTLRLSPEQSAQANRLLEHVRRRLIALSDGDPKLLHHVRRRIRLRLEQDERSRPGQRKRLKKQKWYEQHGRCALCPDELPKKEVELDRIDPYGGYTRENTRLVHHACHRKQQLERGFK
ncbi:MAG: hypothetical protein ACREJ4_07905 [Candidatus Methylomirabilaceae bacterium]